MILNHTLVDIICLNEHWLNSEEICYYVPDDFVLADSFTRSSSYGGSSIYLRKNMSFKCIDISAFCQEFICEGSAVRVSDWNIIILCIYRTPDSSFRLFIDNIDNLLQHVFKKFVKTMNGSLGW